MGEEANEISGLRKAGDHPARGAILSAGSAGARADRHPEIHVLSMVRSLSDWRARGAGRSHPRPDRVWNRIPDDVRARIVTLALDEPELSPGELAVRFTDAER